RRVGRRAAAEEDRLHPASVVLLVELPQECVDVRPVQVVAPGRRDEVAVAAAVGAEGEMDVEVADAHAVLFGLGTSSPPQFGQTCSSVWPQAAQNVHSKE